jgi:Dyp-type peroxidase family
MTTAVIDRADIQGDILQAYGKKYRYASYIFIAVPDAARGRAWLSGLLDRVTTYAHRDGRGPESTFNVALTRAGLAALGVPPKVIATFSHEFCDGMAGRANELGDLGHNAPASWNEGLGTGRAHVLVTIKARNDEALDAARIELLAELATTEVLSIVHESRAYQASNQREHFGFRDGFSQPAIEGAGSANSTRGEGVPEKNGWRPLSLGEFILGYADEETLSDPERRLPSAPSDPLGRNGTYMVWRKLHEDVALFRRTIHNASHLYPGRDEKKLAAKVVGRWQNGAPLVTAPDWEPATFDPNVPGTNDFRYDTDPNGYGCPLGAHIRRSNPRDALGFEGYLSFRHRIIRRGMPYGPELPEGIMEDDREERGLIFVCYNASISRQFESLQRQWLNDGNSFHLGDDVDFLLGGSSAKITIQGDQPFFLAPQEPFVTMQGGEYLFVPGITALAAIADGVAG